METLSTEATTDPHIFVHFLRLEIVKYVSIDSQILVKFQKFAYPRDDNLSLHSDK